MSDSADTVIKTPELPAKIDAILNIACSLMAHGASAAETEYALIILTKTLHEGKACWLIFPTAIELTLGVDEITSTNFRQFDTFSPQLDFLGRVNVLLKQLKSPSDWSKVLLFCQQIPLHLNIPSYPKWLKSIFTGIQCGATALFFGGDRYAFLLACIAAMLGFLVRIKTLSLQVSDLLSLFITSLVSSAVVALLQQLWPTLHIYATLSAGVIWLVPGIWAVNGLSDAFHEYSEMAAHCFFIVLSSVFALTIGLIPFALYFGEGLTASAVNISDDWLLAAIASVTAAVRFGVPVRQFGFVFVLGALGHGGRAILLEVWHFGLIPATFLSSLLIGIVVVICCHQHRSIQLTTLATLGAIPLVPGAVLLKGLTGLVLIANQGAMASQTLINNAVAFLTQGCLLMAAIGLGLILPNQFFIQHHRN